MGNDSHVLGTESSGVINKLSNVYSALYKKRFTLQDLATVLSDSRTMPCGAN